MAFVFELNCQLKTVESIASRGTDNDFAANVAAANHTQFCRKISRASRCIGTKTRFAIAEIYSAKFAKDCVFSPPSFTGDLRLSLSQGSRSVSRQRRRGSINDISDTDVNDDICDISQQHQQHF